MFHPRSRGGPPQLSEAHTCPPAPGPLSTHPHLFTTRAHRFTLVTTFLAKSPGFTDNTSMIPPAHPARVEGGSPSAAAGSSALLIQKSTWPHPHTMGSHSPRTLPTWGFGGVLGIHGEIQSPSESAQYQSLISSNPQMGTNSFSSPSPIPSPSSR